MVHLKLSQKNINTILILSCSFIILIVYLHFNNTYDPFLPKHIAIIGETSLVGYLDVELSGDIPNYYIFGSIIQLLLGVSNVDLLCVPIQLVPHFVIYSLLVYILSNNKFVSIITSSLILLIGSSGSGNVFYWPHGIGSILFLTSILLLYIMFSRKETFQKSTLILILLLISLAYYSYNYLFRLDLMLLSLLVFCIISKIIFKVRVVSISSENLLQLFLSLIVSSCVLFGLNNFVYGQFFKSFDIAGSIGISAWDKLISAYFSSASSFSGLEEIILTYPAIFSYINVLRYSIVLVGAFIYIAYLLYAICSKQKIITIDIILLCLFISTLLYSCVRIGVGSNPLANIFVPSILCLVRVIYLNKIGLFLRHVSKILFTILLIVMVVYIVAYDASGYVSHDLEYLPQYDSESIYLMNWGGVATIKSDEGTKNILILSTIHSSGKLDYGANNLYWELFNNKVQILHRDIVKKILNHQEISETSLTYIIRNDIVPSMSLQNWVIIQSWGAVADRWDMHKCLNKISDNRAVSTHVVSAK